MIALYLFIETLGGHAVEHRQIAVENDGLAAHTDNNILWRDPGGEIAQACFHCIDKDGVAGALIALDRTFPPIYPLGDTSP